MRVNYVLFIRDGKLLEKFLCLFSMNNDTCSLENFLSRGHVFLLSNFSVNRFYRLFMHKTVCLQWDSFHIHLKSNPNRAYLQVDCL